MAGNLFTVTSHDLVEVVALSLPDELDVAEFDQLNQSLLRLVEARMHGRWVLDMSEVSYAGSPVLGLLVNLRQQVRQHQGKLVLCELSERLLHIFQACSLERLFQICPTRSDALTLAAR